jgi:hypothetical protein
MPESISAIPLGLQAPVRALARAAYLFRGVFIQAAEGVPIEQILEERGAVLDLADRTLDLWGAHLGLEVGGLLDVQEEESPRGPTAVNPTTEAGIVISPDHQTLKGDTSRVHASLPSGKKRKGPSRGHL